MMEEGKQGEDKPSARPCLEGRHVPSPCLVNLHHLCLKTLVCL